MSAQTATHQGRNFDASSRMRRPRRAASHDCLQRSPAELSVSPTTAIGALAPQHRVHPSDNPGPSDVPYVFPHSPSGMAFYRTPGRAESPRLLRKPSRILRMSRPFSRYGERKNSASGDSRAGTPTSLASMNTSPPISSSRSTPRLIQEINAAPGAPPTIARMRSRAALVHARDSPEPSAARSAEATYIDEMGGILALGASPMGVDTGLASSQPSLQDTAWMEDCAALEAAPRSAPSGLGLFLDADTFEWAQPHMPAAEHAEQGRSTPPLRQPKQRGQHSLWWAGKWREKPLPLTGTSPDVDHAVTKRPSVSKLRLFAGGAEDEERAPRPLFRRLRSDAWLNTHTDVSPTPRDLPPSAPFAESSVSPGTLSAEWLSQGSERALTSTTSILDESGDVQKRQQQRHHVLRELVETERKYAADLTVVKELYLAQARLHAGIHTPLSQSVSAYFGSPLSGQHTGSPPAARPPSNYSTRSSTREATAQAALRHPMSPPRQEKRASRQSLHNEEELLGSGWRAESRLCSPMHGRKSPQPAPPLSVADIHVIFAGLEQCTALATGMSTQLDAALHADGARGVADVFQQHMEQIEQVYAFYCARHAPAMLRLKQVTARNPAAAAFLRECDETSRQHSTAWDLPSLLIKPVQRVLKYPLFLQLTLDSTEAHSVEYAVLARALGDIQRVADRINEDKKRTEFVAQHGFHTPAGSRPSAFRRTPAALRMSKNNVRPSEELAPLTDDEPLFQALTMRLAAAERAMHLFADQCADWAACTRRMYEEELQMIDEWLRVYYAGRVFDALAAVDRLSRYRNVLKNEFLGTICRTAEQQIAHTVQHTVKQVQALLESPRIVLANRASKEVDYRRYLQERTRRPNAKPSSGATTFLLLHTQLVKELPFLLRGLELIMERCVTFLLHIQTTLHASAMYELRSFAATYFPALMTPTSAALTPTSAGDALPWQGKKEPNLVADEPSVPIIVSPPRVPPRAASRPRHEHYASIQTAKPHSPERSHRDSMYDSSTGHQQSWMDARMSLSGLSIASADDGDVSRTTTLDMHRYPLPGAFQ
ncbi:hypothetical protein MVES1_000181 [Malassezia vespertilionis]|nr:uncharacterized protein MVES1_000181 [Malassezia vespertilionis]WFD04857.1 hypothetical protein MVES1_000181 [Malassezia vespertilionis]